MGRRPCCQPVQAMRLHTTHELLCSAAAPSADPAAPPHLELPALGQAVGFVHGKEVASKRRRPLAADAAAHLRGTRGGRAGGWWAGRGQVEQALCCGLRRAATSGGPASCRAAPCCPKPHRKGHIALACYARPAAPWLPGHSAQHPLWYAPGCPTPTHTSSTALRSSSSSGGSKWATRDSRSDDSCARRVFQMPQAGRSARQRLAALGSASAALACSDRRARDHPWPAARRPSPLACAQATRAAHLLLQRGRLVARQLAQLLVALCR